MAQISFLKLYGNSDQDRASILDEQIKILNEYRMSLQIEQSYILGPAGVGSGGAAMVVISTASQTYAQYGGEKDRLTGPTRARIHASCSGRPYADPSRYPQIEQELNDLYRQLWLLKKERRELLARQAAA